MTTLVPHPPSVSNPGLVKESSTDYLIIEWLPPKGGFTKYVLGVSRITLDNELDEDKIMEQDISFLLTSHTIHGLIAGNKMFSIFLCGKFRVIFKEDHIPERLLFGRQTSKWSFMKMTNQSSSHPIGI